jgi:predicted nucleic acid-binding protein
MIFVDTSAWFAAYVPTDPQHQAVSRRLRSETGPVITTDFVVDETMTLLLARRERQRAVNFGRDLLEQGVARLEILTLADLVNAYTVFCRYDDKAWSFTDCTSFVLMQRLRIVEAVALDDHFRQMPGITVGDLPA